MAEFSFPFPRYHNLYNIKTNMCVLYPPFHYICSGSQANMPLLCRIHRLHRFSIPAIMTAFHFYEDQCTTIIHNQVNFTMGCSEIAIQKMISFLF